MNRMMNTASPPTTAWGRWVHFWFGPTDPTTMAFLRVVTGLLVLYTHLAYSFDLQSFFGPDAWYGLDYVNKERRETPHVAPPLDWQFEDPTRSAQLPDFPHRRRAVHQPLPIQVRVQLPEALLRQQFSD